MKVEGGAPPAFAGLSERHGKYVKRNETRLRESNKRE
jgi:hypothetical protein